MLFGMDLASCPDLAVPLEVMQHVVRVESSHNPFAIGVVSGNLVRQPKDLPEALATVRMLESRGFNFSLGIAQVNRYNLGKFGLDSYEKAFQVCPNLQAGSRILAECYGRSGRDWGKSFSCYYSGNFVTGYRHGYVQKIYASMRQTAPGQASEVRGDAIPVVSKPARRMVGVTRYPVYAAPIQNSLPTIPARVKPSRIESIRQPASPMEAATAALLSETPVMLQDNSGSAARAKIADQYVAGPQPGPASSYESASGQSASDPMIDTAFVF